MNSNELSKETEFFIYDYSVEKQSYILIVKDSNEYVLVNNYPIYSKKNNIENWYSKVHCKAEMPDMFLIGRDPKEKYRTEFLEMLESTYLN